MKTTQVTDGIWRLSANVENVLFEGMWPIPNGIAMNSYIVKGEKAAIVDGVCTWDGVPETLFEQLSQMDVALSDIDYVVINHMEPDHSGWLEPFTRLRGGENFQIICSKRAEPLLKGFYGLTQNIRTVSSGDTLDLGNGRVLVFEDIPNVHWPETMATFDTKSGTLLPCDAFGSFGSVDSDAPYDEQLTEDQLEFFERETLRYYSNIVAAFSPAVQKAAGKLGPLDIQIIAPGHGIVWRKDPGRIVDHFVRYASYMKGPAKEKITVIWGSMYGMTESAVQPVIDAIQEEGVEVVSHRVPETHLSYVLQSVWESSGVVLAMPTYEYKMFPAMFAILDEIGKKKVQNRKAFRFGSYGWSGGAEQELAELNQKYKMNWDFLESVEFLGKPTGEHIELIRQRGRELASAVKQWVSGNEYSSAAHNMPDNTMARR